MTTRLSIPKAARLIGMSDQARTLDEAAAQLRMTRDWVRKAVQRGILAGTRIGSGTQRFRTLIMQSEIDRYLTQQTASRVDAAHAAARAACRSMRLPTGRLGDLSERRRRLLASV